MTTGFRPVEGPMPFTAVLELSPNGSGGCHYRALAIHQDIEGAQEHLSMGFHDGWGTVADQMVQHILGS